jgi:hypothetical protein
LTAAAETFHAHTARKMERQSSDLDRGVNMVASGKGSCLYIEG